MDYQETIQERIREQRRREEINWRKGYVEDLNRVRLYEAIISIIIVIWFTTCDTPPEKIIEYIGSRVDTFSIELLRIIYENNISIIHNISLFDVVVVGFLWFLVTYILEYIRLILIPGLQPWHPRECKDIYNSRVAVACIWSAYAMAILLSVYIANSGGKIGRIPIAFEAFILLWSLSLAATIVIAAIISTLVNN